MSVRRLTLLALLALCISLGVVGTAQAHQRQVIEFGFTNFGFVEDDPACPGGKVTFDMVSLDGAALGNGISCVLAIKGCSPFFVGCKQKVTAILTFSFAEGSVTVDGRLREQFISDSSLRQRAQGNVTGGTGAFAGARGTLRGHGTVDFLTGSSTLVYTLRLKV